MKKIYLITKLYNYDDKVRTCELENYLVKNFDVEIYMPFRDSKEEFISSNSWKKEIFEQDIAQIDKCDVLIGFHEFVFDEGIGFEIGYAISQGKEIYLLNSDFIRYEVFGKKYDFADPLFEYFNIMLYKGEHNLEYSDFCNDLIQKKKSMLEQITLTYTKDAYRFKNKEKKFEFFIELGNSKFLYSILKDKNISTRLLKWDSQDDIDRLFSSKKVYVVLDGHQMHTGSSLICGICYGKKIPFYLVENRVVYLVGKELMKSNLMIDYASCGYVSYEDFLDEVCK